MDDAGRFRLLGTYRTPRSRSRSRRRAPGAKALPGLFFALPAGAVISTIAMLALRHIAS